MKHSSMSEVDQIQGADTKNSLRILVVDDSRLQRKILVSSLKKWNYQVSEAASGDDAYALCQVQEFDLVLSDWMMPGMSGIELCQAFRALKYDHYGYFILLTSKSDKDEIARGLEVGADDFLPKPLNPTELHARIRAGERITQMHSQLRENNDQIASSLDKIQILYDALENDLLEAKKLSSLLSQLDFRNWGHRRFLWFSNPVAMSAAT